MNASLGLGLRHALHAVRAGFELELGVDVVTLDAGNHFLVAAVLALTLGEDLDAPALLLGIARIHAEQIAGKDRRLVAASAGADLEEHVAPVVGVLGQQHALQIGFQRLELGLGFADLLLGHLAHVGIAVLEQRLSALEILLHLAQLPIGDDHRLDFGVLAGIGAKTALIADDFGVAEQCGEFFETVLQDVQQDRFEELLGHAQRLDAALGGEFLQLHAGCMQQFVGQATGELDENLLGAAPIGQQTLSLAQLVVANALGVLPVRLEHINCGQLAQALHEVLGASRDQLLGGLGRALATLEVLRNHLMQIVDRVQIDVVQLADLRFDVPRHGDIDHEHRLVLASLQRLFDGALAENRQLAGGGADDDVAVVQLVRDIGKQDRLRP